MIARAPPEGAVRYESLVRTKGRWARGGSRARCHEGWGAEGLGRQGAQHLWAREWRPLEGAV